MNNHMSSEQGSNVSNTDDSSYESDENLFNDIMNIADTVEHSMSLKDNSTKDNIIIEDSDVNNSYTDQEIHSGKNNAVKCLEDVDGKDCYHELDNTSQTHHEEDSMLSVKNCSTNSNDSFDNEEDELQISNKLELCSNSDSLGSGSAETDSFGNSLELSGIVTDSPGRSRSKSSSVSSTASEEKQRLYRMLSEEKETRLPIHSGFMMKLGGTGLTPKNWRKRWFVLRSDHCLYYYKNPKGKPAGGIVLSNYLVTPVMGSTSKSFSFQLTKGGARTYTLAALSSTEMRTWIQVISEATKSDDKPHSTPDYSIHNISIPALSIKDPDCHGYIWKQGQIHKTWKRRYAVLKDGSLFYYKDMSETTAIGVFCLHCYTVNETESISRKYGLVAIPPQPLMRTYYFATETENDRDR
eukprot:gene8608-14619_t